MVFNRGLWKTGVLAVVATTIFAVLIFKAEEWSRGFSGEFLVYGQTGPIGGTSGGTGALGGITKIIPHIVVGSYDAGITKYVTVVQVTNTSSEAITVNGNFYTTTGSVSTLTMTNVGTSSTFAGTLASTSLAAGASLVLRADVATTGTTNWGRIVTSGSAAVSSYFEWRDVATNVLYTRVGVPASAADMRSFVIPRARNVATGLDVGFALVNTGDAAANITGTVRDAGGAVLAARTFSLSGLNHTAVFAREFFTSSGCSPCLTAEGSGTSFGTVAFSSTAAQFAAIALS